MARKAVKKLQDAFHGQGEQASAAQESPGEGSLQGGSRGRTSKRRFLSGLGPMRQPFTPSRSPSRNPGIEGHARMVTGALDEVAQLAPSGPVISETNIKESQEPHQHVDIATACISTPEIRVSAPGGAKDERSHSMEDETVTDHRDDLTTSVHSSDIPLGSKNGNPPKDGVQKLKAVIKRAQTTIQQMKNILNADKANTIVDIGSSTVNQLDTLTACLQPLKVFNDVVNTIADIHPYAKIVLGTLCWASQACLTNRDQSINDLLFKIGHVYSFIIEDDTLASINLIREPLAKIGELVRKGVQFIQNYAEVKSFWGRLRKNIFTETDSMIAAYSKDLDTLTQQCRDMITRDMRADVRKVLGDMRRHRSASCLMPAEQD
ncbi:hypothetical protein ID866_11802 [Astraeus odoratus]|nr:hypothetical protein ID866_11802 [Astraeus odoratus]